MAMQLRDYRIRAGELDRFVEEQHNARLTEVELT
jgi:hypothetical protein